MTTPEQKRLCKNIRKNDYWKLYCGWIKEAIVAKSELMINGNSSMTVIQYIACIVDHLSYSVTMGTSVEDRKLVAACRHNIIDNIRKSFKL